MRASPIKIRFRVGAADEANYAIGQRFGEIAVELLTEQCQLTEKSSFFENRGRHGSAVRRQAKKPDTPFFDQK